jgi:hypothetical protein
MLNAANIIQYEIVFDLDWPSGYYIFIIENE